MAFSSSSSANLFLLFLDLLKRLSSSRQRVATGKSSRTFCWKEMRVECRLVTLRSAKIRKTRAKLAYSRLLSLPRSTSSSLSSLREKMMKMMELVFTSNCSSSRHRQPPSSSERMATCSSLVRNRVVSSCSS